MNLVEKAAAIATQAHEGQLRKDGPPYITHPTAVAHLLQGRGFPDTTVAAAYVHDVLEDTSFGEDRLREALGKEVVDIVKTVSEDKSLEWEERKKRYIESVASGSEAAKAVCVADKIHNLQSVLAAYAKEGEAVWQKFTRGKEEALWFHQETLQALKRSWHHPLIGEYAQLVEKLGAL